MSPLSTQSKRDIKAFSLTLLLYVPLLFWWGYALVEIPTDTKKAPLVLNLQKFVDKEEPIEEESVVEEPLLEDDFYETLDEIMQEPVVTSQPLTTKSKPIIQQKKPTIKKPIKKKKIKKITQKRVVKKKQKRTTKRGQKQTNKTSQFITKLKKAINNNKIYPKMAKKRGLQGTVHVSFTINSTSGVSNITIKGSKMFIKATKRAILQSFPINTHNISLPLKVNLRLNYRLKNL